MNPDEIFVPHGVPFDASRTPVVHEPAPPSSAPPPRILLDQTDNLGITTVILHKLTAESDVGISSIQRVPPTGLVLGEFSNGSVLTSTKLFPTMNLLSINGCDCSNMTPDEAMLLILSTQGELTLKAVHAQVLLFPGDPRNDMLTSTSSSRALVPASQSATAATNNHQSALVVANEAPASPKKEQAPMIKVIVQKSSKRSSVGLHIGNETIGTSTYPVISRIDADGLCAATALQVGMRIWSVNGLRCYTKDDTLTKLKRAKTTVHIEAQQQATMEDGSSNSSAPSSPGGRGIMRSLTPKKWLPNFHRLKASHNHNEPQQQQEADLVRAETGESA